MSFIIDRWRGMSRKERRIFLIGIFIGIIAMAPLILIDERVPIPTNYEILVGDNSIDYNKAYSDYCGEVGNFTTGDRVIILTPAFDGNDYKNIAVTLMGSIDVYWRYICVLNSDGETVEKIKTPESGETYTFEDIESLSAIAIFLYAVTPVYTIELWVW